MGTGVGWTILVGPETHNYRAKITKSNYEENIKNIKRKDDHGEWSKKK